MKTQITGQWLLFKYINITANGYENSNQTRKWAKDINMYRNQDLNVQQISERMLYFPDNEGNTN